MPICARGRACAGLQHQGVAKGCMSRSDRREDVSLLAQDVDRLITG